MVSPCHGCRPGATSPEVVSRPESNTLLPVSRDARLRSSHVSPCPGVGPRRPGADFRGEADDDDEGPAGHAQRQPGRGAGRRRGRRCPSPGRARCGCRCGAASLNFNDIDRCRGKLVSVPTPPPYTLGMDVCGVVDAAGAGAEEWIGQRVVAITKTALGGIAEYAIAPAVSVFDAPPELDDAEATAFLLTVPHLAPRAVPAGRLQAGETVVIHSAASGLGTRRHPAGQGGRGPGHRGRRRTGEGRAVPGARRRPGDRPHGRGLRRGRAAGHRRRRRRRGLRPHRRRLRRALLAVHGPRGALPGHRLRRRRRQRHDRPPAAHGLHRQHLRSSA